MNYEGLDKKKLLKMALIHGFEFIESRDELIIVCPEVPEKKIQTEVSLLMPEIKHRFLAQPKVSTQEALIVLLKELYGGYFPGMMQTVGRTLIIHSEKDIDPSIKDDHPAWGDLLGIIKRDGYYKSHQLTFGKKVIISGKRVTAIKQQTEQIESANKVREHCPTEDEILNIKIAVNQDKDVTEIIKDLS